MSLFDKLKTYNLRDEQGKIRGKAQFAKQEARIANRQLREDTNGEWDYTPETAAVEEFLANIANNH
jgi:hypothetical protein